MEEKVELLKCLEEKIDSGKATVDRLKLVGKIDGVEKLVRKIQQEIRFLEKVQSTGNVKKEHLQSTNLIHLNAIVARLFCANEPTNVLKPFKYQKSRLEVDIVCNGGASWVKVIARNARALTLISMGNGEYGQKSVLDQASSFLQCAKCYPYLYRPPEIVFHFAYGIEIPLAKNLELMGVAVEGDRIECEEEKSMDIHDIDEKFSTRMYTSEFNGEPLDESKRNTNSNLDTLNVSPLETEIKILNLDVSTLLAYVTNMTNGYDHFIYREPLLTQQAEMERKRPVKPILESIFKDSSENRTSGMRRCDTQKALDQCGPNERCVQNSKDEEAQCMCQIGFELENGQCIHLATTTMVSITTVQSDVKVDSGGSSVAAGLLIPTFLVVIGVLLYLGARRYKWLQRFRLFRPNRYGNVLVTRDDDDDDDPPIA
uniref:UPF0415 protein C7orf25 homolog isoform X2 n=1 Tax=Osmia lignaria TaxID=473952 RepID=UPI0014782B6B|nr:UPF0415 protein C7orf25 homolog isoform X2 [Osmia lignaria]